MGICIIFTVFYVILLARIIFGWVQAFGRIPEGVEPLARVVHDLTEPILAPLRRAIPPVGMLDLSVFIVFILLRVVSASLGC